MDTLTSFHCNLLLPNRSGLHIQFTKPLIFWESIILASIDLFSAKSFGRVVQFAGSYFVLRSELLRLLNS